MEGKIFNTHVIGIGTHVKVHIIGTHDNKCRIETKILRLRYRGNMKRVKLDNHKQDRHAVAIIKKPSTGSTDCLA